MLFRSTRAERTLARILWRAACRATSPSGDRIARGAGRGSLRRVLTAERPRASTARRGYVVRATSEREFQKWVTTYAKRHGWMVCHVSPTKTPDGRWITNYSAKGFPDVLLLKPPRMVVLELKRQDGTVRDEQRAWIEAFAGVPGVVAAFVRPSDMNALAELLR